MLELAEPREVVLVARLLELRLRAASSSAAAPRTPRRRPARESSFARISLTVGSSSRELLLEALARLDAHRVRVAGERRAAAP